MNAQIGKNVSHKFSLLNSSNRNGEHLADFTLENRLTCLNRKFQKRNGKLWTYTDENNTKAQIDYEAHSSYEDVFSAHRIVTAKMSLPRNTARTTTTVHYDRSLLNKKEIRDRYASTQRNKFDALQETETRTPSDEYKKFVNAHLETAAECIPPKQRAKPGVPWEILAIWKKACRRENCFQVQ